MTAYDPSLQHINCDGLFNLRELGGMPLSTGHFFKKKVFLRSDSPSLLTKEQIKPIKEYGVKTVIDLRSEAEVRNYGNPFIEDSDIYYRNVPLFLGDPDLKLDPTMIFLKTHKMGDFYVLILDELADRIVEIMRIFLSHREGICMFHCAHGKDRTGVISACLYLLAGASREDIIKNYSISYSYVKELVAPLMLEKEDCLKHTLRSDAENMAIFLDHIDERYDGKIENYLLHNKMSLSEIDQLRKMCID